MKQGSYLKQVALAAAISCTIFACSKNTEPAPVADKGSVSANSIIGTNADTTKSIIGTNGIIGGGK